MIKFILLITALISTQAIAEQNIIEILEPIGRPAAKLSSYIAEDITSYMTKQNNYQVEAKSYHYKDQQITFQHQLWKVKENSVCSTYPNNTQEKSKCQVTAKSFFNEVCQQLNNAKNKSSIQTRTQNMYCNAAVSFQPKIIRISKANALSEIEIARSECNALILKAMGNNDPKVAGRKEETCNKYKALKNNSPNIAIP